MVFSSSSPNPDQTSPDAQLAPEHRARAAGRARAASGRVWIWGLMLVAACGSATGCRSLSKRGPNTESVAACRQLTQQGMNAMERADWKRAESLLARAVSACPADADARRQYAEALWHRGATAAALAQFEESRRLTGEDVSLTVRTGELYLAMGRTDDAKRMVDESLNLDPKFALAWALRGRVAAASGQTRQALADYQRSLGYAPENDDVALLVAETYRQLNEPDRALLALQAVADNHAAGEEPQQVMYLEGLALQALGRYEDAAQQFAQAARRDRPTAEILCHLAEAELQCGRPANAQASLQEALALEPGHAGSRALSLRMSPTAARTKVMR